MNLDSEYIYTTIVFLSHPHPSPVPHDMGQSLPSLHSHSHVLQERGEIKSARHGGASRTDSYLQVRRQNDAII